MVKIVDGAETPKKKPLREAVIRGVKATDIGTGLSGLRLTSKDTDYISFGGVCSKIAEGSELHAFMQDLKLSEELEITIKKVDS
jgi:hypothetical protein